MTLHKQLDDDVTDRIKKKIWNRIWNRCTSDFSDDINNNIQQLICFPVGDIIHFNIKTLVDLKLESYDFT